jgi:protein-tyrosine kinase
MALIHWQQPSASAESIAAVPRADFLGDAPVTDEAMIGLWQQLRARLPRRSRITLGVIAATPGEGVSTVVRGLARVVAKNPRIKILICELMGDTGDAFMRPSVVDLVFSSDRVERSNSVQWLVEDQVALGSLGDVDWLNTIANDPESVRSIVAALSSQFELVLLDLPPLHTSMTSPAFARVLDGVVMVVEAERTPAQTVRTAHDTLSVHGANVLGVVLNKRRLHGRGLIPRLGLAKWVR